MNQTDFTTYLSVGSLYASPVNLLLCPSQKFAPNTLLRPARIIGVIASLLLGIGSYRRGLMDGLPWLAYGPSVYL